LARHPHVASVGELTDFAVYITSVYSALLHLLILYLTKPALSEMHFLKFKLQQVDAFIFIIFFFGLPLFAACSL